MDVETSNTQYSGPYYNIVSSPGSSGTAATIPFLIRTASTKNWGFYNLTLSKGLSATNPTIGIDVQGSDGLISGVDTENITRGIALGESTTCTPGCPRAVGVTNNWSISGVTGSGTTAVHISNANGTPIDNNLSNIGSASSTFTNIAIDDANACTVVSATESRLGLYSLSQTGKILISSSGISGCNGLNISGNITATSLTATNLLESSTAPTISSGFGTSPSITFNNGTAAFRINVGTGGAATSGVIGLPAAANGWNCYAADITTNSASVFLTKQTASTTSTATIGNFNTSAVATAWTASNILAVSCFAF
jgi:hypothetical protein